jgi:glycosyltransferase involved in cell wall biosynthesis
LTVLRVAIDTTPLIGARTGIGQFTAGLVDALAVRRDDVEIVPFEMTWRGRTPGAKPLPARPMREVWRRSDRPPIEWWTGPVDVVHGTNYIVPPTKRASRLASVHDLTAVRFPELCTADTKQYPAFVQRAMRGGAHLHCDSQFIADEVIAWAKVDPARVHVVYPGIPAAPIVGAKSHDGPPYVLVLGTIEPRKDHGTLLRAFAELASSDPDLRLVVAGADGWGTASYETTLAALPATVRVRIDRHRDVDDAERDRLVAGARVLAYPSIYEGFGFPPLEAMSAGVPVVATKAGSLPEVLGDATSLVAVGDAAELAQQLLRAHTDEAWRADLITRGRTRAATFTWQRCAAEMVDVYRSLAGRS